MLIVNEEALKNSYANEPAALERKASESILFLDQHEADPIDHNQGQCF